ncbi:hypothetical protein NDU88_004298, partial [Pleurodeles waltl]
MHTLLHVSSHNHLCTPTLTTCRAHTPAAHTCVHPHSQPALHTLLHVSSHNHL